MKNQNNLSIAMFLCIFAAVGIIIWLGYNIHEQDTAFDNEYFYEINNGWEAETKNGKEKVNIPASVEAKAGEKVTFQTSLQEQETMCNIIMFRSSHQYIKVFIDEDEIATYGYDQKKPLKMSPGSIWQFIRLPQDWAGAKLSIETIGYYDSFSGVQNTVYTGTKATLMFMLIKKNLVSLFFIFAVMLMGGIYIISGCCFKNAITAKRMRFLGLFAVTTSLWLLSELKISQFFTGKTLVTYNMIFLLFGLLPVLLLRYLLTYEDIKKSKYIRVVYALSVLIYGAINILNIMNIADFMQTVFLYHLVIVLIIGGILGVFINSRMEHEVLEDIDVFVAGSVLGAFALVDLIVYYFGNHKRNTGFFSQIGLTCFIGILGFYAIRHASHEWEKRVEQDTLKKLAYTDILTGIKNRTAFEEAMDYWRQENADIIVMVLDINNLKIINDTLGHKIGDRAIIVTVSLIKKYFSQGASCYRIGGDEFVVISDRFTEVEFQKRVEHFQNDTQKERFDENARLNVAHGYVQCKSAGIDNAFMEADARMYENKNRMKNT